MQRLRDRLGNERGAVNVVVALLMVPMMGFMAIAVDVAAMWADKQQLQTGADAGALAIAQDCALGACGETQNDATAGTFAVANKNDGAAIADATASAGKVTVTTETERTHWFAQVLGFDSSTIGAASTAGWGAPTGGTAMLPMTYSVCEFEKQVGPLDASGGGTPTSTTPRTLKFTKSSGTSCTGPSGNVVPGGFGWLATDPSAPCNTTSLISQTLSTQSGNSVPSSCTSEHFIALQNKTVLIPIFDEAYEQGSNAYYRVYGYAAFTITGYYFADSKYRWNSNCSGTERCIHGYFTQFVDTSDRFSYEGSGPAMGGFVAGLELTEEAA